MQTVWEVCAAAVRGASVVRGGLALPAWRALLTATAPALPALHPRVIDAGRATKTGTAEEAQAFLDWLKTSPKPRR